MINQGDLWAGLVAVEGWGGVGDWGGRMRSGVGGLGVVLALWGWEGLGGC